jgi:hypothetical protein
MVSSAALTEEDFFRNTGSNWDGLEHVPQSLTNLIWHGIKNKMR